MFNVYDGYQKRTILWYGYETAKLKVGNLLCGDGQEIAI